MVEMHHFDGNDDVLRFVQERSDDIDAALIVRSPLAINKPGGVPTGKGLSNAGMILRSTSGEQWIVSVEDAEAILNDGILNRMKITIRFKE